MEDIKKRDLTIDEIDTGSGDEVAATPKKRGRPANPNKPPAKPATGRGRGRPAKNAKKNDDDSDEVGIANGDKIASGGRGRPRKAGKLKVPEQIVATGKGRGRPKKSTPSDVEQSDDNDDENDGSSVEEVAHQPPVKKRQKIAPAKSVKKLGRPRKPQASDEGSRRQSDEEYERQPVGRPATGAINLNIERTGRGQGRPKKDAAKGRMVNSGKRSSDGEEGTVTVPKKRGRPSLGQPPVKPSGKPRGRPKSNVKLVAKSDDEDVVEEENDDDEVEEVEIENGEKKDNDEGAAKTTTTVEPPEQVEESEEDDLFLNAEESNGD